MAEIIASVLSNDAESFTAAARQAAMAGADWIELRLDEWTDAATLERAIAAIDLPVLACCRATRDGGRWNGTDRARRELLTAALNAGALGLDLEDWEEWTPASRSLRLLVRSHHDFKGVPTGLRELRDRLLDRGADVAKIVGMAHDLADAAPLCELMAMSDPVAEPTVAFAMGRSAAVTRLLALALGAPYVYASVDISSETAPGQLPIPVVAGLYCARELGQKSSLFGLLGDPALESLGPWVHNRALRRRSIDGVYLPLETARPQQVLDMLPRRRLSGLSVTAPHKERLVAACHRLTPAAETIGAVNTLTFEAHGQIVGHNTDLAGVQAAFRRAGLESVAEGEHAVVFGGGGAARAAAVALDEMGFAVTIMARSLEAVRGFAAERGFRLASPNPTLLDAEPPRAVVNATPIGTSGTDSAEDRPLPEWTPGPDCYVLDMVYRPRWTPLLRAAADAGATAIPGIEMFLTQAAEQFALFSGSRPDEEELRSYLAGVP